jgi:hypothetical protein
MDKIVDVLLREGILISYPISLVDLGATPTNADFITLAKESLAEDGYSDETIATAEFKVRDSSST